MLNTSLCAHFSNSGWKPSIANPVHHKAYVQKVSAFSLIRCRNSKNFHVRVKSEIEKKVFPTLTVHFFNSGHGDAYRRTITPCCIFTESFTFPPRTVQKWHEFQKYILGEKPKSRQSWKNWRKNPKNHVSISFVLETTAFYQKWICRSVRHFFSFFKIFQLCYVNFFNSGHVMVIFQLCSYPRTYVQIFSILSPMVPKLWTTVHLTAWC